ncbi:redoxin domain-containing protein [Peribacillus cavernae]|uniref:Redoxin domain-containing protein n=1 Tax=Peribacillus cavernae TaxID=1674310 RepID=A0A433HI47_9BACI|nr:redoxin domain-containing protein [Peribacillus cavernae]MDQ0220495.1 peroxiredoxin [Peribacillus cavernae]RUQ28010.1 redoxin domain-containing protein [Peribacillus cavernae]
MFKKIFGAALLIVLLTVAIVQSMDHEEKEVSNDNLGGLKVGAKAPDFELKTLSGEKVSLSDYEGKKVMINFWATWCPPCKKEMPEMEKFHQKAGSDVVILAVNIDPENDVKGFVDEKGVTFPILLDQEEDLVNEQYQVMAMPTTFFVDKEGVIKNKFVGGMTLTQMESHMNKIK